MPDAATIAPKMPTRREIYSGVTALAALRWVSHHAESAEAFGHLQALVEFVVPRVGLMLDEVHRAHEGDRTGLFDDDAPGS